MSKMRKFFKSKKAFTLVELIAVLVIMAIAASIVMPNIQGVISNTEYRKNITNCLTATTFVRSYVDLLNLGENYAYYEKNGKTYSIYIQGSPSGLQFALNQYNLDVNYQYYVVPYETSAQSTNPTATIQDAIAKQSISAKDTMVTCVSMQKDKSGNRTYSLVGFWYYNHDKGSVVCTYKVSGKKEYQGYKSLK